MVFKTSNRKRISDKTSQVKILGTKEIIKELGLRAAIEKKVGIRLEEIETFSKMILNDVIYGSSKIQTKNCDSCFRSKDGKLGIIEFFITLNNKFYVCAKQIVRYNNPFLDFHL